MRFSVGLEPADAIQEHRLDIGQVLHVFGNGPEAGTPLGIQPLPGNTGNERFEYFSGCRQVLNQKRQVFH
jgi:hypothetical protein